MREEYAHWLEETDYRKAIGQLRLSLNGVFEPFRLYGMNVYVDGAIDETVHLCEQFGKRIRGKDAPIVFTPRYGRIQER